MRILMSVTVKELKLLMRDPGNLILLFILPAVFILVLSTALQGAFSSSKSADRIEVLVLNEDKGHFGKNLIEAIDKNGHFKTVTELEGRPLTRAACQREVASGRYHVAVFVSDKMDDALSFNTKKGIELLIDPTFSKQAILGLKGAMNKLAHLSMLAGKLIEVDKKTQAIDRLSDKIDDIKKECESCEADLEKVIRQVKSGRRPVRAKKADLEGEADADADAGVDKKEIIAKADEKPVVDKKEVEATVSLIERTGVEITESFAYSEQGDSTEKPDSVQQNVPGWTIFALFWIAQILTINILHERQTGAYKRVMVSPISFSKYMLSKTFPFALINLIQAVLMFSLGVFILPELGCPELVIKNVPALALVTAAVSVTAIAFGILMASLARSLFLAASVSASILIIMTAVGGIMVPRFVMPELMQKMSYFVPHGWALEGYLKVIVRNQGVSQVLTEVGVLMGFAAVFTAVGLFRLRRLNQD